MATHVAVLILGAILVGVAWRDDASRQWRLFVLVLALCVLVPPLVCLLGCPA